MIFDNQFCLWFQVWHQRFCTKHLSRIHRHSVITIGNEQSMRPFENGPQVSSSENGFMLCGLRSSIKPCRLQYVLNCLLETESYPHAVPFKTSWSCLGHAVVSFGLGGGAEPTHHRHYEIGARCCANQNSRLPSSCYHRLCRPCQTTKSLLRRQ